MKTFLVIILISLIGCTMIITTGNKNKVSIDRKSTISTDIKREDKKLSPVKIHR